MHTSPSGSHPAGRLGRTLLALTAAALAGTAAAQDTRLTTARGAVVHVAVDAPPPASGPGPFPAVVLAPGQGYHMGLPALARTAQRLAARGVVVYRFDWAYLRTQPPGTSSPDLSAELEDLQAVIRLARADARVDGQRVLVGGKSLGSLVAWQAFQADARLAGALLLTPLCSRVGEGGVLRPTGAANYPAFATEQRPVTLLLGDRDHACDTRALYAWAATAGPALRIAVVGGDHGFEDKALAGAAAEQVRDDNVHAVAELATHFALSVVGRRP